MAIRDASSADEAAWRALWQGYLDFYDVTLPPEVTSTTWARLMDPASPVKVRLAEEDGQVMGFAIHLHHPSTWVLGEDAYLEDLFVASAGRGRGLGRALIEDLYALARAKGWHRVYWLTDQDNATARRLYDSLAPSDNHIRYRRSMAE